MGRRVIERARADLEQGRAWKARDRLYGALAGGADDELLTLLGQVLYDMGDLPAAGRVWFATSRHDVPGAAASQAWTSRYGGDELQMWLSLPRSVRVLRTSRVEKLRRRAEEVASSRVKAGKNVPRDAPRHQGLTAPLVALAVLVVVGFIFGAGFVAVFRWAF